MLGRVSRDLSTQLDGSLSSAIRDMGVSSVSDDNGDEVLPAQTSCLRRATLTGPSLLPQWRSRVEAVTALCLFLLPPIAVWPESRLRQSQDGKRIR